MFTVYVDNNVTLVILTTGPSVMVDGADVMEATDDSPGTPEVSTAPALVVMVDAPLEMKELIDSLVVANLLLEDAEIALVDPFLTELTLGKRFPLLVGAPGLDVTVMVVPLLEDDAE